jgi:hypothetical protein
MRTLSIIKALSLTLNQRPPNDSTTFFIFYPITHILLSHKRIMNSMNRREKRYSHEP